MSWVAVAVAGGSILGGLISGGASKSASKQQAQAAQQAAALQQQQYQTTRQDLMDWQQGGKLALSELEYLMGLSPYSGRSAPQAPTREQYMRQGQPVYSDVQTGVADRNQSGMRRTLTGYAPPTFNEAGFNQAMQAYTNQNNAMTGAANADPRYGSLLRPFSLEQFQESPAYRFNLEQGMDAINKATRASRQSYNPATLRDIGKYAQGVASNEFLNAYNMYGQDQENVYRRLFGMSASGQNAATQTGQFGAGAAAGSGEALMGAGNARAAGIVGQNNAIMGGIGDAYNSYLMSQILRGNQSPAYAPPEVNI